MEDAKRKRLEAVGFKSTMVDEFLNLSLSQSLRIEIKQALSSKLKATRLALGYTQSEVARLLNTRQPNIVRLESGADRSLTIDILIDALAELGLPPREISKTIEEATAEVVRRRKAAGLDAPRQDTLRGANPVTRTLPMSKVPVSKTRVRRGTKLSSAA